MRFTLNFIKEFLPVEIAPQELASVLTMAGMEVERLEKIGQDWALDIEVTANRYDWLSILGIAREAAAGLDKKLKVTYPKFKNIPSWPARKIIIEDNKDCPFYVGRLIKGVRVCASPAWLRDRVANCNIKSINNIVDITNYCMLKWGNPLHAFDEDKLQGDIYIRRAKAGEAFIGIDDKERVLKKDNLVIADGRGVIALAGVIGGKNTEVDARTKNVFLEAAIFSPLSIRHSRRSAGVDTDSSYRFERRVSPDCLAYAAGDAARLMEELAGGKLVGVNKAGAKPALKSKKITVSFAHLNSYLGGTFPKAKVKKILANLDFKVKDAGAAEILVSAPAFRFDINREVDVYEEFARLYGYNNIAAQVPFLLNRLTRDALYEIKGELRRLLPLFGFWEIVTYSIEGEQDLNALGEKNFIRILNPLRRQENVLRTTLVPGMAKSIRYNLNRNQGNLRFFETAGLYLKEGNGFRETAYISLGITGAGFFFHLKGVVEAVLGHFNIKFSFKEKSIANFTNALRICAGPKDLGFLGKLDAAAAKKLDLKEELVFAQIDVNLLLSCRGRKRYEPFSPYPVLWHDISIGLRRDVKFKEVEDIIKQNSAGYLADLRVVDIYKGKDLNKDTTAFTLRIFYQAADRTLTSPETASLHERIREKLSQREGIDLR